MKNTITISIIFIIGLLACSEKQQDYRNFKLPIEKRVDDLLKRMTLSEKISQMKHVHCQDYTTEGKFDSTKLDAKCKGLSYGCVDGFGLTAKNYASSIHEIQKYMVERTRLGIPIIPIAEAIFGIVQDSSTIYPQVLAQGSTFNPELVNQMATKIGREAEVLGIRQVLAPDLDIVRELRWGRVEETFGEDPFLNGIMGLAYVNGIRNSQVACTPKHFMAHSSPMGGINLASVSGGKHELFSTYITPFEMVFKHSEPLSTMNCYSSYDGEVIAASKYFLTDLLRNRLGFNGYIYSDWGSVEMIASFHKVAKDNAEAAKLAVEAGLDLEAASDTYSKIDSLVQANELDEKLIDQSVRRILEVKFKLGLFDKPYGEPTKIDSVLKNQKAREISRKIADESIILLKNNNLLPLNISKYKSIALIGPNADQVQFGDYCWTNSNNQGVSALSALRKYVGNSLTINYALGCDIWKRDTKDIDYAVAMAKKSDISIIMVGSQSAATNTTSVRTSGEGYDLSDLSLPGVQGELIEKIHAVGKPIVVVLVSGKPFAIPWVKDNIPAIIVQWYGGSQQGEALVDMIFGKTNPSGKLTVSFPQSVGHLPCYYNYLPSDKGYYRVRGTIDKPGRDYVFSSPDALWNFGYGLSYTNFELKDFNIPKETYGMNDTIKVDLKVQNTGDYDGKEVVQLYVCDVASSVVTPIKQLKAFEKINVGKGEVKPVQLTIPVSDLYLINKDLQKVVEPGEFEIQVGTSSDKILFRKIVKIID